MFSEWIREIILRKKKTVGEKAVSGEVDAETFTDLDKMKHNFGLYKKEIISDAIDAWVKDDLKIDETNLIGNQKKLSVKINASLKKKYNEKMEKEGRVKDITLGLIIKTYIENEYKDERGGMKTLKLLNEWREYRDRVRRFW